MRPPEGSSPLAFAVETTNGIVRITFRGDLDISRYSEVGQVLQRAADVESLHVLIVFDESVRFVDSFTLSELLLFRRRLALKFRRVAVFIANDKVYHMLALTNVAERLSASMNEAEAVKALRD